jgi:hypothetical protein
MKLPPFGKQLCTKNISYTEIFLFIGHQAWKRSYNLNLKLQSVLCLPPYLDPKDYQWPVSNSNVIIMDTSFCDDDYVFDITKCMYWYNAKKVLYYHIIDGLVYFFNKEI